MFKKMQDADGADIDLRDTVADIFAGEIDARNRVVQVIRAPVDRIDSIPPGSHLQPPRARLTREQSEQVQRIEAEVERYGSAIQDLDPDMPVRSEEREHAAREEQLHFRTVDHQGFAVPQKFNRPARPFQEPRDRSHVMPDSAQGTAHITPSLGLVS